MAEVQIQAERGNVAALLVALGIDLPLDAPGHTALLAAGNEIRRLQAVEKAAKSSERTLCLTDGDPNAPDTTATLPVTLAVTNHSITLQFPCAVTVTLEHFAGQARIAEWLPAGDLAFEHELPVALAARPPED